MRNVIYSFILVIFILNGCGKSEVKQVNQAAIETQPEKPYAAEAVNKPNPLNNTKISSLESNYKIFRQIQEKSNKNLVFTVSNVLYLQSLSNEFDSFQLNRYNSLSAAVSGYMDLTNQFQDEASYLYQRAGISSFKLGNYSESGRLLNQALSAGLTNSELFYYKTLLELYYIKNTKTAEYYFKKTNPIELNVSLQEWKMLEASLNLIKGDTNHAINISEDALRINPSNFYQNYDITSLYLSVNKLDQVKRYISESQKYLTNTKNPLYIEKAIKQKIDLNRDLGVETLEIPFGLSTIYDSYPNLMYSIYSPSFMERIRSRSLIIPLQEKKRSPKEKIFTPFYETYLDTGSASYILLGEAMFDVTNIPNRFTKNKSSLQKLIATNAVVLLLSPTNLYIVSTNNSVSSNSREYIVSNQSNVVYQNTLDVNYYIDTYSADMNNNSIADFLFIGTVSTNQMSVSVFFPDTLKWDIYSFPVKTSSAKLIIQDYNQTGKKDIILMDESIYFLTNNIPNP